MTLPHLMDVLNRVGKPTELYTSPDGSVALILPHGGRILGLFSPQSEENFFWTHPALSSVESARQFYDSEAWHNSGGDRTWLSPEVDFFFPDFPNLERYCQPRELDPGDYRVFKTGDTIRMVNRPQLTLSRPKEAVELAITKSVSCAPNPLRYDQQLDGPKGSLEYAAYALHTSLELTGPSAESSARVGLWNLLQLPHGGELLASTYCRADPRVYFGTIPLQDLIVEDNLIRYKMRAAREQKLGIRAVVTTGRVGYLYSTGEQVALVIRNFAVNPSGEYVDVPWTDPDDVGYAAQACNVNSALGSFSELEYHTPAIGKKVGRTDCHDVSEVWAFRGPAEAVQRVARSLLSSEV